MPKPSPAWIGPVPNLLTGLRLALAATFPLLAPEHRGVVVLAAGLSDVFDGWIARCFHAESALGRLLDGIADKAFVLSAVVTFTVAGEMAWWEGLAVLPRGFMCENAAQARRNAQRAAMPATTRSRASGKATTLFVFAWFLSLFVVPVGPVRTALFVAAATVSVVSALDYLVQFFRLRPDRHRGDASDGSSPPTDAVGPS